MSSDSNQHDRRNFYRITDNIALAYQLLPADFNLSDDKPLTESTALSTRMLTDLARIDQESRAALQNLPDRDVKACLMAIHEKIDLVARYVATLNPDTVRRFEHVNISGGGIQFPTDKAIENNRTIKLELLLYPSCASIHTYANVLN